MVSLHMANPDYQRLDHSKFRWGLLVVDEVQVMPVAWIEAKTGGAGHPSFVILGFVKPSNTFDII